MVWLGLEMAVKKRIRGSVKFVLTSEVELRKAESYINEISPS